MLLFLHSQTETGRSLPFAYLRSPRRFVYTFRSPHLVRVRLIHLSVIIFLNLSLVHETHQRSSNTNEKLAMLMLNLSHRANDAPSTSNYNKARCCTCYKTICSYGYAVCVVARYLQH
ncbi:hypothetical protein GJ744_006440 [Endocarpon pusillum]|uniref:Uncharacterized protein n=1 Tax=Endocarpon pusillum TaxID=364733 RepID=A0A8H7DYC0_9EURO|nr:hypothetical protein GJ744_006440 [Endocarpon pusillum]